eukprot:1628419-Prymnesium_polylepis.1
MIDANFLKLQKWRKAFEERNGRPATKADIMLADPEIKNLAQRMVHANICPCACVLCTERVGSVLHGVWRHVLLRLSTFCTSALLCSGSRREFAVAGMSARMRRATQGPARRVCDCVGAGESIVEAHIGGVLPVCVLRADGT